MAKLLLLQRSEGGCDDSPSGEEAVGDVAKKTPWALILDGVMLGDILLLMLHARDEFQSQRVL